jgi:polysaccharide export outer membrane protein
MKKIFAILVLGLLLTSCSSTKENVVYLRDLNESTSGTLPYSYQPIKLQAQDELVINVSSEIPGATASYNLPFNNINTRGELPEQNTVQKYQTYIVNNAGDITFPILGKIHVAGMTTMDLADYLTKRISENVENPVVRVDLLSFKVQVTGAVNSPRSVSTGNERMTVLEAITAAGDVKIGARYDNVLIIREENGEVQYHRINLTDSKSITSPYYYLKQNDVVYVEPGETIKQQLTYNSKRSFNMTTASLIVSTCSVIASLIIAFAD